MSGSGLISGLPFSSGELRAWIAQNPRQAKELMQRMEAVFSRSSELHDQLFTEYDRFDRNDNELRIKAVRVYHVVRKVENLSAQVQSSGIAIKKVRLQVEKIAKKTKDWQREIEKRSTYCRLFYMGFPIVVGAVVALAVVPDLFPVFTAASLRGYSCASGVVNIIKIYNPLDDCLKSDKPTRVKSNQPTWVTAMRIGLNGLKVLAEFGLIMCMLPRFDSSSSGKMDTVIVKGSRTESDTGFLTRSAPFEGAREIAGTRSLTTLPSELHALPIRIRMLPNAIVSTPSSNQGNFRSDLQVGLKLTSAFAQSLDFVVEKMVERNKKGKKKGWSLKDGLQVLRYVCQQCISVSVFKPKSHPELFDLGGVTLGTIVGAVAGSGAAIALLGESMRYIKGKTSKTKGGNTDQVLRIPSSALTDKQLGKKELDKLSAALAFELTDICIPEYYAEDKVLKQYVCPINRRPIRHVMIVQGNDLKKTPVYYEKAIIEKWIQEHVPETKPPGWPQGLACTSAVLQACNRGNENAEKAQETINVRLLELNHSRDHQKVKLVNIVGSQEFESSVEETDQSDPLTSDLDTSCEEISLEQQIRNMLIAEDPVLAHYQCGITGNYIFNQDLNYDGFPWPVVLIQADSKQLPTYYDKPAIQNWFATHSEGTPPGWPEGAPCSWEMLEEFNVSNENTDQANLYLRNAVEDFEERIGYQRGE